MKGKKAFFARPTVAQIKEGKEPLLLEGKIVEALQELPQDRYAIIAEKTYGPDFNPAKFLKHGETYKVGDRPFGKTPLTLLREVLSNPQLSFNKYMSGYSFVPRVGPDRTPRRVPFVELLEAARIVAYGKEHPEAAVKVEGEYFNAKRVGNEGGSFLVSTPSRTAKHDRYRFIVTSIPTYFVKPFVYLVPYSFASQDIGVESKAFRELRFAREDNPESNRMNYIQAHEIAAAYAIAEKLAKRGNSVPLRFLPFPAVSSQAVDFYITLLNRTLLQVEEEGKVQLKHLNQAHLEPILWRLVRRKGYSAGFDDGALREDRIRNYNWKHV